MAKVISSLSGSTGILSRTSQLINDGESGVSTYVELDDISTVATTGDYNNLINVPIDFTPRVHTHNISDISGTKSKFNTSLTDGDFLFVGDVISYTNEEAQDAVGSILTDSTTIDFTYDDTTPTISANVKLNSIDATHLADGINITEFTNNANYETTSQLNIRDTNNRNRVNHTGEQPISTVTGLQTNLDLKQDNLVSGTSIKTLEGQSLLGSGNIDLVKADVGLSNVDNTSDSNKPISTAQQTALNTKESAIASGTISQYWRGDKTWQEFPTIQTTVDQTIIDGSTNAVSGNAVNTGLALKSNDNAVVHLAGTETITGLKTFSANLIVQADITALTNFKSSSSNIILSDNAGTVFRGTRANAWSDNLNTRFFQVGSVGDNIVFTTQSAVKANRFMFHANKTQVSSGNYTTTIAPLGIFEVTNGTSRFFNVFESGNSVFGGGTDDSTNKIQVAGTVSSGTTTAGNTPPTANNQLTRKDYVDTGLGLKANLASPTFTGVPLVPTAPAGANTTQIATTAFVAGGLATKENAFSKNTAFNKNFGTTVGTVVEGGTLGSNAYSSTAYSPLTGGTGYIQNQNASAQSANMWIIGTYMSTYNANGYNIELDKTGGFGSSLALRNSSLSSNSLLRMFKPNNTDFYDLYTTTTGVALNGTVTASPATLDTQLATLGQVRDTRPYKVYTALISQSGTSAPVATVLENTLGGTVVWSREAAGFYNATLAGAFTLNKTTVLITQGTGQAIYSAYGDSLTNRVKLIGYSFLGVQIDDLLNKTTIEIRVYN